MDVIPFERADRVHMVARDAGVLSHKVVKTMRTLGYEGIRSPSSRVDLSPIERDALMATVDVLYPRDPQVLIDAFLRAHPDLLRIMQRDHDRLSQHNPHPTPKSEWDTNNNA